MNPTDIEIQALDVLKATANQQIRVADMGDTAIEKQMRKQLVARLEEEFENKNYTTINKIVISLFELYKKTLPEKEQPENQQLAAYESLIDYIKNTEGIFPNGRSVKKNLLNIVEKPNDKIKNFLAVCYGNATNFESYCKQFKAKSVVLPLDETVVNPSVVSPPDETIINSSVVLPSDETPTNKNNSTTKNSFPFSQKTLAISLAIIIFLFVCLAYFIGFIMMDKFEAMNTLSNPNKIEVDSLHLIKADKIEPTNQSQTPSNIPTENQKTEKIVDMAQQTPTSSSNHTSFKLVKHTDKTEEATNRTIAKDTVNQQTTKLVKIATTNNGTIDSTSLIIENVLVEKQADGLLKVIFAVKNNAKTKFILTGCELRVSRDRSGLGQTKQMKLDNIMTTVNSWIIRVPYEIGTINYQYEITKRNYYHIAGGDVVHLEMVFYQQDEEGKSQLPDAYDMRAIIWAGTQAKIMTKDFKFKNEKFVYDGVVKNP